MSAPLPPSTGAFPAVDLSPSRLRAILALLSGVVFVAVVNASMVQVALPLIGESFSARESIYGWIVTGFSLTFGIFSAVHGRLADRIGIRRLYVAGIFMLGVAAMAVAFSPTIDVAIALRLLQGAGSAAVPALGPVIVTRLFPPERRGASVGVILGAVGLAASIGPFLGGVLVQLGGWRAVFLFTGAVLFVIPLALRLLPTELDERRASRFDLFGALLLGGATAAFLTTLSRIRLDALGDSLPTLGIALIMLAFFVMHIRRVQEPFVNPRLFGDLRYVAGVIAAFCSSAARLGSMVVVPIVLLQVHEVEPITVGFVLLPGALVVTFVSSFAGHVSDRMGSRAPTAFGMAFIALGTVVTAWQAGVSPVGMAIGLLLFGLGFTFTQSPLLNGMTQILPPEWTSTGMGLFMMIFFLGGAFGMALSLIILEVQPDDVARVLLPGPATGARHANAMLSLLAPALIGFFASLLTPGHRPVPMPGEAPIDPVVDADPLPHVSARPQSRI